MNKSNLFLSVVFGALLVLSGCGGKNLTGALKTSGGTNDKATCKSINAEGKATFVRFAKSPTNPRQVLATFTWVGRDNTVYDTNQYTMSTDSRCITEEKLMMGSTAVVEVWVQCPTAPGQQRSMSASAVPPYGFIFPKMKSQWCEWTIPSP